MINRYLLLRIGTCLLALGCMGISNISGLSMEQPLSPSGEVGATPRPLFEPLYLYYGAKVGLSFLMAGTAMTDPGASSTERAVIGGSAALIGIPALAIMHQARRGNVQSGKRLRYTAFFIDLGLSAVLGGFGVHRISNGSTSDQYTGMIMVSAGLVGMTVSSLNLVPFRME